MASNLIIHGDLVNPPSSVSSIRELTFFAHEYLHREVLLECSDNKDFYYKFLKLRGAMDFIDDILLTGEEKGDRIDTDVHYAPTVFVTKVINQYNILQILQSIGFSGVAIGNLFKFNK